MIDITGLRRKANSTDIVDHIDLHANIKTLLSEMIDHLEAAEKEVTLKERVIDALGSELNAVAKERDELRAKVEQMERQEPVATIHINSITGNPSVHFTPGHSHLHHKSGLYALPGAKGE